MALPRPPRRLWLTPYLLLPTTALLGGSGVTALGAPRAVLVPRAGLFAAALVFDVRDFARSTVSHADLLT